MSIYTTRLTRVKDVYVCQILKNDVPFLQATTKRKDHIGPTFRDLLRTIDKLGIGDEFTGAVRERAFKTGNIYINAKHEWV